MSAAWFTAAELSALRLPGLSISERAIQLRAKRENWQGRRHAGRMGPRALKSLRAYVARDTMALWPMAVYVADGHCFDAEVRHPRHNRPFRPEITTVLDVHTRRIGQVVEFVPAPLADAEALVASLSEVAVKPCLIRFLHQVAGGKLREIKEGIAAIERFGKRNPGQAVGVAEMAGQVLLNDRATGKPITVRI